MVDDILSLFFSLEMRMEPIVEMVMRIVTDKKVRETSIEELNEIGEILS